MGWKITAADETAIAQLPETAWAASLHQDGTLQAQYGIAELTGLNTRDGWPEQMRLLVRRTAGRPSTSRSSPHSSSRPGRYQIVATNIGRMWRIAGSHQPQWLDVLHRAHAGVEDRVRTNKAIGLSKLPGSAWTTNCGWILAANLAADLDAWTRLLGLHDHDDLALAEPGTLRYRLLQPPAKLTRQTRRRTLAISRHWPCGMRSSPAGTDSPACQPAPDDPARTPRTKKGRRTPSGPWNRTQPQRHAKAHPLTRGTNGQQPDHASDNQSH